LGSALAAEAHPGSAAAAPPERSAALDGAFDQTHAAADAPEAVRAASTAAQPAALKPAERAPSRWKAAVPNLLTFSNMAGGLAASFLASEGHYVAAAVGIIAAVVFDALDGRAARALGVKNPLGIDLDSLADIVSFGTAPALLIFKAALLPAFGWLGFPIAATFAAAGLYRLARFNVGAHAEKSGAAPARSSDSFTGLPIPGGAGVIVALTLALAALPAALVAPIAAAVTRLTAGAMVSRLPYPAFKKGGAKALIAPALVGAAAVVPLVALGLYAFIPAVVFGLYLVSGPLLALAGRK
ncbi:MAG: CDP-alcohol phosphatidyltransferase family protein, partial [Elusimicrobiota bacterium]